MPDLPPVPPAVSAAEAAMDAATRISRRSRRLTIVAMFAGVVGALMFGAGVYVVGHLANAVDTGNGAAVQRDAILRQLTEQSDHLRSLQDRSAEVDDRQSAFLATVARLIVARDPAEQTALRAQLGEFAQPGAFDPSAPRPSAVPPGPAPGSSPPPSTTSTSTSVPPGPTSTAPTTTTTRRRVLPTLPTVSVPPSLPAPPRGASSSSSGPAVATILAGLIGFALLGAAVHASFGPDTYARPHGSPLRSGPRPPQA
jgi:hypothetical protein